MKERRNEIIKAAIEMVADEGYASLSMRALAREVGMKLASLQYHFKSSDELLKAIVNYVAEAYRKSFAALYDSQDAAGVREIVAFSLADDTDLGLVSDRLWPQLWAMQQVEPLVSDLVEDIYSTYLDALEQALIRQRSAAPHTEALLLMSVLEGSTLFMGEGRRWNKDAGAVREALVKFIDIRYGKENHDEHAR